MIARHLISENIVPLKAFQRGKDALDAMNEHHVRHLPIVEQDELLGLISEDEIFDSDAQQKLYNYPLTIAHPFVYDTDHIYEIMRYLYESKLTLIPVINKEKKYLGSVTLDDLLKYFAESTSLSEHGSVVVLTVPKKTFSLSEIARIVESEHGIVLNSFINSVANIDEIDVTLKINRQDISPILATFERFDYEIKAAFSESEYVNQLQENYDSLMSYLNV